ncbi:MAG: hypothetical protein GY742_12250 [Hyphomicrobiales bacterium]|nr:hypothetical protein [Hyphomicrobiales bacterium]
MKYLILILVLFHIASNTNSAYANQPDYNCTIDENMICGGKDESQVGSTGQDNESDEEPESPQ